MDHSRSTPNTMRAVRCHRFADVEPTPEKAEQASYQRRQQQRPKNRRPSFRPRKPGPLRLRDCLSLERVSRPNFVPKNKNSKETTIVIRTEYAGVQYPDALQARGLYQIKPKLPYTPGMDVVGVVLEVVLPLSAASTAPPSSTASRIRPGDRVMATLMNSGGIGGLSEVVLVPLKFVYKLPLSKAAGKTLHSPISGAAFANIGRNYFAAYHSLVEVGSIDPYANENTSKIVLVTGASGGVGMATIELAKAMGCTVVAGVGTTTKKDAPESVGADLVLCYGRTKAERRAFRSEVVAYCRKQKRARGVDLVVDVVFGELFGDALVGCLKPLGTIALVGFAAGQKNIKPGLLLVKEARVAGSLWGNVAREASETNPNNKYRRMVETILGYLADGSIKPRVDRIVPLHGFLEAFEVFEENKGRGNTVVSFIDDEDTDNRGRRSRL